jgi:hypothetical protein
MNGRILWWHRAESLHRPLRKRAGVPICASRQIDSRKDIAMTTFDDRETAFENMFAHDEEMAFRVTARRNKLLGLWAAQKMGLTAEEADAYGKAVVQADFEEAGDEDVVRKVMGDLTAAGIETNDEEVRSAMADVTVEARRQLMESK